MGDEGPDASVPLEAPVALRRRRGLVVRCGRPEAGAVSAPSGQAPAEPVARVPLRTCPYAQGSAGWSWGASSPATASLRLTHLPALRALDPTDRGGRPGRTAPRRRSGRSCTPGCSAGYTVLGPHDELSDEDVRAMRAEHE